MEGVEGEVAKGLGKADSEFDKAGKRQGGLFGSIVGGSMLGALGADAIKGAISGITGYFSDSIETYKEAEQAQVRLQDAYTRFPAVANVSIESLRALNTEIMNKTRFDDDALATGQATLAQYGLTGDQLAQLTPLLADYAAKTGVDATTAADQLGKAMLGQGRALKGVGIDFVDTGSVAGNFAQVMDGLTTQVGGFAETEGLSAAGTAERMKNAFGELQETIGGALLPRIVEFQQLFLQNVMPLLVQAADWIANALGPGIDFLGKTFAGLDFSGLGELLTYMSPLGLVFQFLGPLLPQIASAFGEVFTILGGAVASILPVLLPVLSEIVKMFANLAAQVIPMLLPVIVQLAEIFGVVLEAVMPIVEILLNALLPIFNALYPVIITIFDAFLPLVGLLVEALAPILTTVADIAAAILVPVLNTVISVIQFLGKIVTWLVTQIIQPFFVGIVIPVVKSVAKGFKDAFGGLGGFFEGIWTNVERGFKGFINFIIDGINGFISGLNEVGNFVSDVTGGSIDFSIGSLPRLAEGGVISARPGGMAAIIGEGRYDEAVIPLSPEILGALGRGGMKDGDVVILMVDGMQFRAYVQGQAAGVVDSKAERDRVALSSGKASL